MSFSNKSYDLVKQLEESERENAIEQFGAYYNSQHEAYSILLEEVEEATEQMNEINKHLQTIWHSIRTNEEKESLINNLVLLALKTDYLILEAAQVKAVADKFISTLSKDFKEK